MVGLPRVGGELKAKKEINLREYAKYILREGSTSGKKRIDVLPKKPVGFSRKEADAGKIVQRIKDWFDLAIF